MNPYLLRFLVPYRAICHFSSLLRLVVVVVAVVQESRVTSTARFADGASRRSRRGSDVVVSRPGERCASASPSCGRLLCTPERQQAWVCIAAMTCAALLAQPAARSAFSTGSRWTR